MEIIVIIIASFILILTLSNFRKEVKQHMKVLNNNIINVRQELETIKKLQEEGLKPKPTNAATKDLKPLEVASQRLVTKTVKLEEVDEEKPIHQSIEKPIEILVNEALISDNPNENPSPTTSQSNKTNRPKRDYEKLIGENWLNKIGIAILVIGIGFFVKYAIDKNWISEWGRVGIGLLTGGILTGIAHYLRKKFHAFSSVLLGGGISIFYYTISIAYHDYGLFGQKSAFAIMVGITIFSTIMSVIYNRKELAVIALIGGFTSPFMVQSGEGNYIVFFTYIAILNSGMLILSYFKKWPIINKLSLGFTTLFFGAWMISNITLELAEAKCAMFFITLFYFQFFAVGFIYNFVRRVKFTAWEFIQLTGITALFYGGMMYLLQLYDFNISQAVLTLIMSCGFITLAILSQLREGLDSAFSYLMTGKAIALVTITAGIAFDGDYMTLFWAAEGVILLALGQRTKLKILRNTSLLINVITIFALIRTWFIHYVISNETLAPFTNGTFLTGIFVIASFIASILLISRKSEENSFSIKIREYKISMGILIFGLTYSTFLFELLFQLDNLDFSYGETLVLCIFHIVLILGGSIFAMRKNLMLFRQIFFFVGSLATIAYLLIAQINNFSILIYVVESATKSEYYFIHFILTFLMIILLIILRKESKLMLTEQKQVNWFLSVLSVVGLIIATVEMDQIIGYAYGGKYELYTIFQHTQTEGYTILWGIYSFVLMLIGMKLKNQIMRILALAIFSITLLKLFIFDIQDISEAGKIIAFISLGILLLVISFMYQKLKALIVGETESETITN